MLSNENPPPDPPCPLEISQLKSSSDERDSDKVALQEVDLLESGLDDNNLLPKFSIREYVFSARNKDIKTNWPFSQENLQLCLEHGMKDLLPPFRNLYPAQNISTERCTVEISLIGKQKNRSNFNREPCGSSNHFVPSSSDNEMLAVDCVNISSSGSEGDRKLPLTTNNQSHTKIDSIPADRTPLEITRSSEAETTGPLASQKIQSIKKQPPVKKCRLIAKVDTTANSVTFPETMTSKLCPVCKTFTSSSNTTLNIHIDQCLFAVKSAAICLADCRLIKHGIKSRKTRSIVDIYAAAPQCSLEELDRRNGTKWAMKSSLESHRRKWTHPFLKSCSFTRENVVFAEEEKQRVSAINFKEKGDEEGAVYIDANGKKIRILSKFNDTSSVPKLEADFEGGRGSKSQKHLKLAPQSKKKFSSKPRRISQVHGDQERSFALEESCRKEGSLTQPFKALEQTKLNDPGSMAKWACSKRTGLLKTRNSKKGLQQVACNFRQKFPVESDQSSLGVSYMERSCVQKMPNSYESPLSSPESSKRVENSSFEAPINECNEQPPVRKTVGFTSLGYQIGGNMERILEPPKCNVKQLRKDSTSVDGSCKNIASYGENYVPSLGKEPVEINAGPVKNGSHDVCSNLSRNRRAFSTKATKFSSLRKQMLSVNQSCVPESKYKVNGKCSFRKKSGLRSIAKLDEEVVALPSVLVEKHDSKEKHAANQSKIDEITGKVSLGRCSVLQIRKKRGASSISQDGESMTLKSASECHNHEVGNDIDSSARVRGNLTDTFDDIESGRKGIQTHKDDIETGPSSGVDFGGNVVSLSKSLDPKFHKLASPSNTLAGALQSVVFKRSLCGAETPLCPNDPRLGDEQEIFCVDEVGNSTIAQNADMGAEMDSKDEQGNYFTVVDPIPIPGPPGSFLPSPGDMGSEDLQGNSSLSTSRVQSYEDQHDQVDRDSSDSPISAMSTISNSTIARSDTKSSEIFSVEHHVTQDEIRLGFSCASDDAVAEKTAPVSQAATIPAERINLEELKVNMMSVPEKGPISFRNDQPCCCSRKEGMSQGGSLNFQESQLLRRRTMASVPVPDLGKQLNCDPNKRPEDLNSTPEVISLGNFPSSGSEKVVLPVTKSAVGPVSVQVPADSAPKSPIYGDCDSASPSASNPVLRLMGKNLMVVNQDENVSQQLRPALNVHPNPQFQAISGVPPGNIQNVDFHSFHHMVHPKPLISGQNQCNTGFKVDLLNSFGSHVTSKTPQTSSHASAGMFLSKNVGGGFTSSLELHKHNVRYSLPNDQNRSRNRPYTPSAYKMEKVATNSGTQLRNANSITDPMKEIIIIDDTPEREADSATDAPFSEGMRESRVSSAGISIPMAANYNSRQVNPFYSYQPQDSSPYSGSHRTPHSRVSASPTKWNCTSEGSSVLPPSSLKASSSSTGRLRSSLYYSPGFS